ncbi:MAG: hypothetical protein ACXABY_04065 [Candidatus Thorarchaeota archaeon]|jgi:hypothetical protein
MAFGTPVEGLPPQPVTLYASAVALKTDASTILLTKVPTGFRGQVDVKKAGIRWTVANASVGASKSTTLTLQHLDASSSATALGTITVDASSNTSAAIGSLAFFAPSTSNTNGTYNVAAGESLRVKNAATGSFTGSAEVYIPIQLMPI